MTSARRRRPIVHGQPGTQITATSPAGIGHGGRDGDHVQRNVRYVAGRTTSSPTWRQAARGRGIVDVRRPGPTRRATVIPITVTFDEQVVVTGSPRLALNANGGHGHLRRRERRHDPHVRLHRRGGTEQFRPRIIPRPRPWGSTGDDQGHGRECGQFDVARAGYGRAGDEEIVIDTTTPTVKGVSSTEAAGTYEAGTAIPITVAFSEAVTVTAGTPQLALNAGSGAMADYTSGSGYFDAYRSPTPWRRDRAVPTWIIPRPRPWYSTAAVSRMRWAMQPC